MSDWKTDDPTLAEAYRHGRTQERLSEAVESLRPIAAVCRKGKVAARQTLLEVEADAAMTLQRLSAATGGVIDDVEPL